MNHFRISFEKSSPTIGNRNVFPEFMPLYMKYAGSYRAAFSSGWSQGANPSGRGHLKRSYANTCHSKVWAGIRPLNDATFSAEMRKVTPGPPRHLQTHQQTLRISPQQRLQQVFCPQNRHQKTLLYDFIMYSPSAARTDTASFVWVSNTRIPVHVCFIPDTTGPWYITNWFNLSRNLNNAIVPFVRVNVPTGPAWSISVRWIVAFISVTAALRIPCRGVKEGSRADVWRDSFDAPFHSECRRVYTFFSFFLDDNTYL